MKGSDVRDALFARLFGLTSIIQSGALFASSSSLQTFDKVIDNLLELGQAKGWLRESAWWGILGAAEGVLSSQTSWKDEAMDHLADKVYADKAWSQEKIALTLVLEEQRPVSTSRVDERSILIAEFALENAASAHIQAHPALAPSELARCRSVVEGESISP